MQRLLLLFCVLFSGVTYAQTNATELRVSFADAVERVAPAVVNIYSSKVVADQRRSLLFSDPFFDQFFNEFGLSAPARKRVEQSLGSGVILTPQGHFVTNYHVIEGAQNVRVVFNDGREGSASLVSADPKQDLAVMKLNLPEGEELPVTPAQLGETDNLGVGDVVLAVGNPYGFGQSVSLGIVSAVGRSNIGGSPMGNYIQTDAAINPGSSGGALIDSNGMVVGINTSIFSRTGAHHGIGFAVPAEAVAAALDSVQETGEIRRPWLGVEGQNITFDLAEQLGLERSQGVLLHTVLDDGPAGVAGLDVGDVVLQIDGQPVADNRSMSGILATKRIGDQVVLTLWRSGKEVTRNVRLTPVPVRPADASVMLQGNHPLSGYRAEELSIGLNYELGLPLTRQGVVITEVPARQAFGVYLKVGDVIESLNGMNVTTLAGLEKELGKLTRQWRMVMRRGEQRLSVQVQR